MIIAREEKKESTSNDLGAAWQYCLTGLHLGRSVHVIGGNNKGNGQKRELPVFFWPKTDIPENNSGRGCG